MIFDSIVIGAGQAGLGTSCFLQKSGLKHIVFEQGRIGESWLSMRWDSFKLNTLNFMNVLPDLPYEGTEPDGFWGTKELTNYFQKYVDRFKLPVQTDISVLSVNQSENNQHFIVKTKTNGQSEESVMSRSIVVASGILQTPKLPQIHTKLPQSVTSLHSADYSNANALPAGAIVVVGSGQTGCQIVEDLLSAGRTVYLCTSKVGRVPRRYRGKDILEWWIESKFVDVTYESLEDKSISNVVQPQISGLGRFGHTVSLQYLASKSAVILGRLLDIEGNTLILNDDAADNVHFADNFSQKMKDQTDSYLSQVGITLPPLEDDIADKPDPDANCASRLLNLNLKKENVSTIIWATGFKGNFSWLNLPVLDIEGKPIHQKGISPVPGLYFIGFPWLNSRKSGIIYGIEEDARFITDAIQKQLYN